MLRKVTALSAVTLVALSVAAIVMAQDRGGPSPLTDPGSSQMRVRKLPPVGNSDPKADVMRLDHFGQGSVSQARLVDENAQSYAPHEPGKLTAPEQTALKTLTHPAVTAEQIEAAKIQAIQEGATLSSGMQRDLGIVLAAGWSATNKAKGRSPRSSEPENSPSGPRQLNNAPLANQQHNHTHQQPYDSRYQRQGSSLQDKLNSLRDTITGTESPEPARKETSSLQPPQVVTDQPHPASQNTTTAAIPVAEQPSVIRSNAPAAPEVPTRSARSVRTGSPTLATSKQSASENSKQSAANPLQSSRQRRDLGSLVEAEAVDEEPSSSLSDHASRGAASVASTPVSPAMPSLTDETDSEVEPIVSDSVAAEEPLASLKSDAEAKATEAALSQENVLLSLEGPQLTAQAVGPRRIVVSQNAEFQVTVKNSGSVDANDVIVSVQLPDWVDVVETIPTRGTAQPPIAQTEAGPLLWRISRLQANSSEVLKLNLIPRRSQPLDMSVRWTYAHAGSNTLVEVEEPLLQMVISGPSEAVYGQTKLYNLTLSNPGTGDAHNVSVSLLPLEGKQESAASTNIGTLAHGETKTIQVELSAGKAGTLLVKAKATADGDLSAEAAKEVLVRRANLVIEVVAPEAEYAGNAADYLLRVTNNGNANAEDITVNAVLPEGAQFVKSSSEGRYEQKQGRVRWDLGSLSAGQMREVELTAKLHSPGENRLHTTVQDESDLNAVADVQTAVIARADLKLLVVDPTGPVPVGEDAVYELHILNRGTEKAEAVEAVIFFSEGIEPVSVEGADHEIGRGQVMFKTIPQINSNGEMVLKVTARAERTGNHVFRAEVLCRSIGTKLAAEETTHYYGKELAAEASQPLHRTATRPATAGQRGPAAINNGPSPLPPASIDQQK